MQVLPNFFFTHPHPISLDGYYVDYPRDELRIKVIVYSLYTVESVRTGVMLFDMYTRFGSGTVDVGKTNPYLLGVSAAVCPLLGASVLVLLVYLNIDTAIRDSFDDHASIVYVQNLPFIPQSMVGGYHHLGTCLPPSSFETGYSPYVVIVHAACYGSNDGRFLLQITSYTQGHVRPPLGTYLASMPIPM